MGLPRVLVWPLEFMPKPHVILVLAHARAKIRYAVFRGNLNLTIGAERGTAPDINLICPHILPTATSRLTGGFKGGQGGQ